MSDDRQRFVDELVRMYGPALERYLARKLENAADAAEVAQEAFLRIYRLEHPEQLDNARAFLFQVASNLAIDQLRRRQLHFRFLKIESRADEDDATDIQGVASPEQIIAAREKLARIYAVVDKLHDKCRQAFLLHRSSGLSYSEIAQELGVFVSSVEKYILQALKACRTELASYYDDETDENN